MYIGRGLPPPKRGHVPTNPIAMGPTAVGNTASILVSNLIAVLNGQNSSPSRLEEAIMPLSATQRPNEFDRHISAGRLSRAFGLRRRSSAPNQALRMATYHFHRALKADPAKSRLNLLRGGLQFPEHPSRL